MTSPSTYGRLARLVALFLVVVPLVSCASGGADDEASTDGAFERLGEPSRIAQMGEGRGQFELVAQDSAEGPCLEVHDAVDERTVGCGFDIPELHDVGFFTHDGPDGLVVVAGAVSTDTLLVRIDLVGAAPLAVEPVPAPGELAVGFFGGALPEGSELEAVTAIDAAGAELERRPA